MRCGNCVLSDNYPGITFDEKGICNFCNNFYNDVGYNNKPDLKILQKNLARVY
ncbi:MAG: hypothetical protein JW870_15430 [Candidatus Delongbacteria bacterium]|nr:hypothetical protein [Candidatus Delongbacteria bacterium]